MWWIIGIVSFVVLVFLWMIVHSASSSIDNETQAKLDDEQTRYVTEYQKEKEEKSSKE